MNTSGKTITAVLATIASTAVIYELSLIGVRALDSDIQYVRESRKPVYVKKHWWSKPVLMKGGDLYEK